MRSRDAPAASRHGWPREVDPAHRASASCNLSRRPAGDCSPRGLARVMGGKAFDGCLAERQAHLVHRRACSAIVAMRAQRHDKIVLVLSPNARNRSSGLASGSAMAAVALVRPSCNEVLLGLRDPALLRRVVRGDVAGCLLARRAELSLHRCVVARPAVPALRFDEVGGSCPADIGVAASSLTPHQPWQPVHRRASDSPAAESPTAGAKRALGD